VYIAVTLKHSCCSWLQVQVLDGIASKNEKEVGSQADQYMISIWSYFVMYWCKYFIIVDLFAGCESAAPVCHLEVE
jgi:hypothetical protein